MTKCFKAEVISKEILSDRHFLLRLFIPADSLRPRAGQFYLIRTGTSYDPLLRRPFSVFNWDNNYMEFLIMKKGRGTEQLLQVSKGMFVDVIGPLGRGFPLPERGQQPVLVGGGIGIAPLYLLAREIDTQKIMLYGGKSRDELIAMEYIKMIGDTELRIFTEDGSEGIKGTVLDGLREVLTDVESPVVYICGPGQMIETLKGLEDLRTDEVYVSVEERMACGIGVCLGCAYPTREGMKRVCIEGPVFKLSEL